MLHQPFQETPFGFVIDYLCFGGIYRDTYLKIYESNFITYHYFHTDKENYYIDYKLNVDDDSKLEIIFKKEKQIVEHYFINNKDKICKSLDKFAKWDIDNPNLYELTINLYDGENIIDTIIENVGFRTIEFKENGLFLNDKKVKIRGINRHQSYPYVGYAMPASMQKEDAKKIKSLGINAVRTSHYPQSIDFLNECDKLGLLVFEEFPGWQNIGDALWKEAAIKNVQDMILRDLNHPSIMLWGVRINESPDDHDFYVKTNALAHECDPYRPTGGVRCIRHSELLEDVYTYNDFICTNQDIALADKEDVTESKKPYFVSEFGGHMHPTKPYDTEMRRTDQAHIHAKVLSKSKHTDNILGTFGWCFFDYNTHKDFGSGDLVCYHGICDMFRNIKYAAYPYLTYNPKPFLEVTSDFSIGEYDGSYMREVLIFSNCDYVKMYHNNKLVNTFKMEDNYKLVKSVDLIGNLLIDEENISKDEDTKIKECILEIFKYNGVIRDDVISKYGKEFAAYAWNLYGKYVANWGSKATPYTFEGYKDGNKVITIQKGPQKLNHLDIKVDGKTLYTENSYDVCAITLTAISNLNNKLDYAFDTFKIECSDNLEIIGDTIVSLIAGVRTIYVKTKALSGEGEIRILSDRFEIKPIKVQILNERGYN